MKIIMMQSQKQIIGLSLLISLLITISRCNDIINVGEKLENNTTIPTSTEKEQIEQMTYKNVVMSFYSPVIRSSPCKYLDGTRKQNHQCKKDPGLPEVLREAKMLALSHCRDQFKYNRWNCSIETQGKRNIFRKVYKETAFVHALTAAALTYQISRACADGKMSRCQCASERRPPNLNKQFIWGGCSDNAKHGKRVARNFLELQPMDSDGSEAMELLRHDGEVGIATVLASRGHQCKCHGVSGSCSMKTCWLKLSNFNITAAALHEKYHQAIRKISFAKAAKRRAMKREQQERLVTIGTGFNGKNFGSIGDSFQDPNFEQLFYLEQSPTFCALTKGRQCMSPENCSTLCCGRGYTTRVIKVVEKCKCRFTNGRCCNVVCDYCDRFEDRYYCK